ncbi:MAG: hypothetical protein LBC68_00870 [Prevotellaceae bacterium]|nr:hypothetical protein [Prevotellaceae bacterium]
MVKIECINIDDEFPIVTAGAAGKGRRWCYNRHGSIIQGGTDCLIFPHRDIKTWEGYTPIFPFERYEIVVAYNREDENPVKTVGIFSHEVDGLFYLYDSIANGEIKHKAYNCCENINLKHSELFNKRAYRRDIRRDRVVNISTTEQTN